MSSCPNRAGRRDLRPAYAPEHPGGRIADDPSAVPARDHGDPRWAQLSSDQRIADARAARDDKRADPAERGEGFLARWSRRKSVVSAREQAAHEEPQPDAHSIADTQSGAVTAAASDEKTDADMLPIESLDEKSDYSVFMSPKVSEHLRRAALRKLFHMPAFNITDGLDDYDEDFRKVQLLGDVITADMRHQMERKQEEARRKLAEAQSGEATAQTEDTDVAAGAKSAGGENPAGGAPRDAAPGGGTPAKAQQGVVGKKIEDRGARNNYKKNEEA